MFINRIKSLITRNPLLEGAAYLAYNNLFRFLNLSGTVSRTRTPEQTATYVTKVANKYRSVLESYGVSLDNKRILELGPGDNLGVAVQLVGWGAKTVVCLDRFHPKVDSGKIQAVYDLLLQAAPDKERMQSIFVQHKSPTRLDPARVEYYFGAPAEMMTNTLPPGSIDVALSNAVLEHVGSLEMTFAALRTIIRPGGYMLHEVDFRSHNKFGREDDSYGFLLIPDRLWHLMGNHVGFQNRRRFSDYVTLHKDFGFELLDTRIIQEAPGEMVEKGRTQLARRFPDVSDEDLRVLRAQFIARVPAP